MEHQNYEKSDFLALLAKLLDYRWLIFLLTSLFFVTGIVYAVIATPVYEANALIQVEEKKTGIAGLEVMDDLFLNNSQVNTEIGIIKSRTLIGKAVDNLQLTITAHPKRFPIIGDFISRSFSATQDQPFATPFLGLSSYDWGGSSITISQLQLPNFLHEQALVLTPKNDQQFELSFQDDVLLQGKVGELVSMNGLVIKVDTLEARELTEFIVSQNNRAKTIKSIQSNLAVTEQRNQSGLVLTSFRHADAQLAENLLTEITRLYVRQNIERASAEATNSLNFLREQLPTIRQEMEFAEKRFNEFQVKSSSIDITAETSAILDQLVKIDSKISEIALQEVELEVLYTRSHPTFQTVLIQKHVLTEQKQALEKRVSNLPELQQELLRLKRDAEVTSELYTLLLQKAQEFDIAKASAVGYVRIIDKAETDIIPVLPKKKLIVFVFTFLGGLLALAIAYLHSMLNQGIRTPEEIESLNLAVYASIPFSSQQLETRTKGKGVLTHIPILSEKHPEDLTVEAFRSLRTGLHFTLFDASNKTLMITGPNPKVGKTFVAINLATVTAQAGKKVLLIDGDMRKGHLHRYLNNSNTTGLSEILSGQSDIANSLQQTHINNLDFISKGKTPPNPSELLLNPRFEQLLHSLNEQYDLIIIDAPPVLAVTDALIIGNSVGNSLMVVRFDQNPAKEIEAAVKQFEIANIALKGTVFNAVRKTLGSYYKYGYANYRYSYKSEGKA